jgi:hypothetical protein
MGVSQRVGLGFLIDRRTCPKGTRSLHLPAVKSAEKMREEIEMATKKCSMTVSQPDRSATKR